MLKDHSKKVILDLSALAKIADGLKEAGSKIVVTIGSWDMLHIGHGRYAKKAKMAGDVLIVGVDSDRGIKLYKGPTRPMIPEKERMEMLSYMDFVDFVTLVDDVDENGRWQYELVKTIRPDVFVAVVDSYPQEQLDELKKYCGEIMVLERQAETSTSNQIRSIMKEFIAPMIKSLVPAIKFLKDHKMLPEDEI